MFRFSTSFIPTLGELNAFIEGVEKEAIKDLRPFWKKRATPLVIEEMARIFATEGYGTWPPLSPPYAAQKRKYYPGKRILRKTDLYYRSVTRRGAGNVRIYERNMMTWGVDLGFFASRFGFPYPIAHEKGGKLGALPVRSVFNTAAQSQILQNNLDSAIIQYLGDVVARETKKHFGTKR